MKRFLAAVEKHVELMQSTFAYIWKNPETGFREWKTHACLKEVFLSLGYSLTEAGNIPGFTAEADTGRPGPTILVFGEMDGLIVPGHPDADPVTGAVHACGHACQTAALAGLAAALKEPGALDGLSGKVRFVVVPAEEGIEFDFRQQLKKDGVISYTRGKTEFLHRGLLDGGEISLLIHTNTGKPHRGSMNGGSNGLISKSVRFEGVATHAAAPYKAINALYAANLALNAINALRETFRDDNHIRVHPILSQAGTSVNSIPNHVVLETYVRGANMDAVVAANKKVNRAIAASAAALGAKVRITDEAGSFPRWTDRTVFPLVENAMDAVLEGYDCDAGRWGVGCSDMGDMASLMPTVQAYVTGVEGKEHGVDYRIYDVDSAVADGARILLLTIRQLLENDAQKAREAVDAYKPRFASREEFFALKHAITREFDAVTYRDDGSVVLEA